MGRKFSREIVRILLLIPLLIVMGLLFMWQSKPRFEDSFTRYANLAIDSATDLRTLSKGYSTAHTKQPSNGSDDRRSGLGRVESDSRSATAGSKGESLFKFDPNNVTQEELMLLGFSQKQAQGILNYRKAGAVFRTAADFGRCYTVSDEKLQQLLPYINIGEEYRRTQTPSATNSHNKSTSSGMQTAVKTAAIAASQADTQIKEQYFAPPPIDLNSADSATLIKVRGIGSLTAQRIIEYRNRMGGFARIEQLQEIQGMNERNYISIIQQIFIDSSGITKIDINFALPEQLKGHPYLPSRTLNKLLKQRQLKGGWRDTGDLIEQNILSREEAEKLAPYLYFRPITVRNH